MHEAALLRAVLNADSVCYWRTAPDGVAIPVACSPNAWLETGFLMPPEDEAVVLARGEAALERLPFVLRATLTEPPGALLSVRCGAEGGFFAAWRETVAVPDGARVTAELARAAYGQYLVETATADVALDSHLRMRGLVAALPQGVAIVPNGSRRGFVNKSAARWLGIPDAEVELGTLSAALARFAAQALNAEEVQATIAPFLEGLGRPVMLGCVWRFAAAPQALRVTVAPIGAQAVDGWVWLLDDISAEELAKDLLRQREEKFRLFYQGLQDAVVFTDLSGRLIEWNDAFRRLLGYSDAQLGTMTAADLTPLAWRERLSAAVTREVLAHGYSSRYEKELLSAAGKAIPVEARSFLRKDETGSPVAMWEVLRDISEQKNAEAQLVLAAQAFDRATDGVVLATPDRVVLTVNDAFAAMSGYSRDELAGKRLGMLKSGRHDAAFYRAMRDHLAEKGWWQGEIWNRRKNGDLFLKWLSVNAVKDAAGAVTHYLGMYRDAAIVSQSHARIEYLATHDALTGLPNRTLFDDRFKIALARAAHLGRKLALLIVDLDDFKAINDTFGHTLGDALLVEASLRLTGVMHSEHALARHGGDEFVALVEATSLDEVVAVCQAILSSLARPHHIGSLDASVPASIGASVFPGDGDDPETLMRKADTALHRAKQAGKHGYRFFTEDMAEQVSRQLRIESGLRQALVRDELFLVYQPQIHLDTGRIVGCEALVRWRVGGETIPPANFIPIAENSSLIVDVGEWVFAEVLRQIARWARDGLDVGSVSVNIAARHFKVDGMMTRLRALVDAIGIAPGRICLEITEGALMEPTHCEPLLAELKAAGFQMSLDDFGTGFSSLSYLKRFPIDELKIDKSFVDGIEGEESDRAIIAATLSIARSLGMEVVAEGVENARQLAFLKERDCAVVQGYLFSRPLAPEDFLAYARRVGGR